MRKHYKLPPTAVDLIFKESPYSMNSENLSQLRVNPGCGPFRAIEKIMVSWTSSENEFLSPHFNLHLHHLFLHFHIY